MRLDNGACASVPLKLVDMTATNPHPTEFQATRLSFSRNFETRADGLSQSRTGAEITGLSVQIWEASSRSANRSSRLRSARTGTRGSTDAYWAGFDGSWWTASVLSAAAAKLEHRALARPELRDSTAAFPHGLRPSCPSSATPTGGCGSKPLSALAERTSVRTDRSSTS